MRSRHEILPTHAVESRKIHNGFDTDGSGFQARRPWETSDVPLIFVLLDDASKVRSCNFISEHHVLAI